MKWDFWHMRNKDKDRRRKKLGLRKTSFFFQPEISDWTNKSHQNYYV